MHDAWCMSFSMHVAFLAAAALAVTACDAPGGGSAAPTTPTTTTDTTDTSPAGDTAVTADDTAVEIEPEVTPPTGLAILGHGSHVADDLVVEPLVSADDGLAEPRGVAFNPNVRDDIDELWIADAAGAMVIWRTTAGAAPVIRSHHGMGTEHFMPSPVALAFSTIGTVATIQETDWVTQPQTPEDFMGPTLFPADSSDFDGDSATHLDMLHNSPNSTGITSDHDNAFWVFDGYHGAITYYDFHADHGPGGNDHSDGTIVRWVEGQVRRVPGVSSNLALAKGGTLFIADTGNARIATLDTRAGTRGGAIGPNYDDAEMWRRTGVDTITWVDMAALGAPEPTGLVLHDGLVFVSERTTSRVYAFGASGDVVDWVDLAPVVPAGQLGSITFDRQGRLVVIDVAGARVLRLSPSAAP